MTNTAIDVQKALYDTLCRYVDVLGAPVLALWGINDKGHCLCPKGEACGKNAGKHPHGKLCPKGLHSGTTDKKKLLEWTKSGPLNWGIVTGKPLPTGGYLIVLDCDPRNGSGDTLEDAQREHGPLPRTPTQLTGGGGEHLLFRVATETPTTTCGEGLDRKGAGGYIVVEPSMHYSGKLYTWDALLDLDLPIADAPEWIANGTKQKPRPAWTGKKAVDSIIGHAFKAAGWLGNEISEGRHTVNCPWSHLHTDGRGKGGDASAVILPPTEESSAGGFVCKHSHCATKTWKDAMAALPPDAQIAARKAFQIVDNLKLVPPGGGHIDLVPSVDGGLSQEDLHFVRSKLLYTPRKDGKSQVLKKDLVNIVEILRHDPRWNGILSFDNFSHQIIVNREPPWRPEDIRGGFEARYPRQWADDDDIRTKLWLSAFWAMEWERAAINDAVVAVAQGNGVHPVRSYLRSLEWDGKERVDTWLIDYCGVPDSDYARNVGRWWLISAVARVMRPGCKADHVLILEGPQGIGKSTVFQILGGLWVCDSTVTLGDKDAYQLLKGRWIIELAELDSLNKADSSRAKAFFTSPTDTYRPSYGRATITVPRQCVFAGTVNHGQFLRDETGNRRYWPVLCRQINTILLAAERDQLWAEAHKLYESGARWWPAGIDEQGACLEEQAMREFGDEWEVIVARWLAGPDAAQELEQVGHITVAVIMEKALKIEPGHWTNMDMTRVGRSMQRLGWKKIRVTQNEARLWAFIRP